MYTNLFIYLALAIAIDGCRGHIRVKRIAETSKIAEKKTSVSGNVATILESPSKVASDEVGGFQKGHALNTKRSTMDHSANGEHFMEDTKRHVRAPHETAKVNAQQHFLKDSIETGDVALVKAKETDDNLKGSEKNLENKLVAASNEPTVQLDPSLTANSGTENVANLKDQQELPGEIKDTSSLRLPRKASNYDGRGLSQADLNNYPNPSGISTGVDNHLGSHGSGEEDSIKKLIEDVKLEGHKKELKPDVDVFLYSDVPAFYKPSPVLFEVYNAKETVPMPSMDHFYPSYKWLQRRSPMQSALEIANMMVKVGLDELENEDYDSNFANKGSGHKLERRFGMEAGFCPVHAKKVSFDGEDGELSGGSSRFTGCVCSVGKSIKDASSKLEELNRVKRTNDHTEDRSEFKPMPLLKPF